MKQEAENKFVCLFVKKSSHFIHLEQRKRHWGHAEEYIFPTFTPI